MDGTRFTVSIPVSKNNYERGELAKHPVISDYEKKSEPEIQFSHTQLQADPLIVNKPVLLIIDDNEDIRKYIGYILKSSFEIIEAGSGIEGVAKATEKIPDLVLSDIMMPGMNGIELCKALKCEALTCHIPVILLTARASEDYHLEGLVEGADDYITKPFNPEILKAKLDNKIKQLNLYKKKFEASLPTSKEVLINRKTRSSLTIFIPLSISIWQIPSLVRTSLPKKSV